MSYTCSQSFYLVVSLTRGGYRLSGRLSHKTPNLDAGEIAIKLDVSVPKALFTKPQIQATVTIPDSAVTAPVLNATVLDNVREILEQQIGMDVTVRVVDQAA